MFSLEALTHDLMEAVAPSQILEPHVLYTQKCSVFVEPIFYYLSLHCNEIIYYAVCPLQIMPSMEEQQERGESRRCIIWIWTRGESHKDSFAKVYCYLQTGFFSDPRFSWPRLWISFQQLTGVGGGELFIHFCLLYILHNAIYFVFFKLFVF